MEIDDVASGVMKTPTVPDKERTEDLPEEASLQVAEEDQQEPELDATVTLDADQARIIAEVEEERLQLEESEAEEETPQPPPPKKRSRFLSSKSLPMRKNR